MGFLLAEIPQYLIDLGVAAGVIVGVLGAVTQLYKIALVRWVWKWLFLNPWRLLFANPFGGWISRIILGVTAPQFHEVKANAKAQHDEQNVRLDGINERVDGINERLDTGTVAIDGLRSAVEDHAQKFIALEQRTVTLTDTTITTTKDEPT